MLSVVVRLLSRGLSHGHGTGETLVELTAITQEEEARAVDAVDLVARGHGRGGLFVRVRSSRSISGLGRVFHRAADVVARRRLTARCHELR